VNRKSGVYDTVAYSCNHFRTPTVYANPSFCDANDDNDGIFDSRGFAVVDIYSKFLLSHILGETGGFRSWASPCSINKANRRNGANVRVVSAIVLSLIWCSLLNSFFASFSFIWV
jgi:hypothetical protein